MLGVHADVFEALALEALTAEEVSKRCETHPAATKKVSVTTRIVASTTRRR